MKSQKGFIQIPVLITIIVGVLIVGSASYTGVKRYRDYKLDLTKKEQLALLVQQEKDSEVEKLKQEVETLKEQKPQIITQEIIREVPSLNLKLETPQEETTAPSLIKTQNQNQAPSITEIVGHWRFFTAKVEDVDGLSWGSGLIIKSSDGTFKVLTNKHVVEYGSIFNIKLPGNPIDNILRGGVIYRGSEDFSTILLGNSNEYLKNLTTGDAYRGICSEYQKPILGDEILILGYPGAGSQSDITITKGIISGFERNYFITDAKINPGNSGGVAINIKNNCYFGIPTGARVPEADLKEITDDMKIPVIGEALGRILDIWKVTGQF